MNKNMWLPGEKQDQSPKRIVKIKIKQGEFLFTWEKFQPVTKHWDRYSMVCKDLPRPEFLDGLQALVDHVIEICDLNNASKQWLTISGVSLSYPEAGNRYLVITAQKELSHSKSPLIINTPARPEMPENEVDGREFCWSDALVDDISELEKEAWMYIDGDRAQQSLDFNDGGDPAGAEKDVA